MSVYWPNGIFIHDYYNEYVPRLWGTYDSTLSLEEAIKAINFYREHHGDLVCAWVTEYDNEGNNKTVWFKNYVNSYEGVESIYKRGKQHYKK